MQLFPKIAREFMWLNINHIVESAMKLKGSHGCSWETLVSKANHKNVAVWSTRSMLVSGRLVNHASLHCHHVSLNREWSRDPRVSSESRCHGPFCSLVLELSLLTVGKRLDTSEEEDSLIRWTTVKLPLSLRCPQCHDRSSAPLRTLLGLALVAMNRIYDHTQNEHDIVNLIG